MSTRDFGSLRLRPPPPPPRRTSSSRDTSPDSGLSVSSTSSHPSTTSLDVALATEQSSRESDPMTAFSQDAQTDESQLLEDICSSLDSSTLTVLSLPAVTSKVEKLRANSHSLNNLKVKGVTKPAPKKPPIPVRRDSLRRERKTLHSAKLFIPLRFSFHSEDVFPPPPPYTNCPKTYPTKELFGLQSPVPEYKPHKEDLKLEPPSNMPRNATPQSKKSEGAFFSKLFSSKPQSEPLRTSLDNASSGVLEEKKVASKQELFANKKPVIAKKPTLDRRSMDSERASSRLVSRSQSLYCAPRPQISLPSPRQQRLSVSGAGGRDKENVDLAIEAGGRAQMVRRAPPPPPRRQ